MPILARKQSKITKQRRQNGQKSGQAILEYTLLVAFMFLIFGMVFSIVRRQLFYIWVCELYPRVASVTACSNLNDCFDGIGNQDSNIKDTYCSERL